MDTKRRFAISTGLSKNYDKKGEIVLVQTNYGDFEVYDRRNNLIERTKLIRDKYLLAEDVILTTTKIVRPKSFFRKEKEKEVKVRIKENLFEDNEMLNTLYQIKFLCPLIYLENSDIPEEKYKDDFIDIYREIKKMIRVYDFEGAEDILFKNENYIKEILLRERDS